MSLSRPGPADGSYAAHLSPPRRSTLTDDVYESITALIMDHVVEPGARISIDGLARDLQVSPTPVREALARLESDGLVRKESLRGYSATPLLSHQEFDDLFEFRLHIEPWSASRAAERRDEAGLERLVHEVATSPEAVSGTDYEAYRQLTAHDTRFHALVLELAGNPVMQTAYARAQCHLHLFRLYFTTGIAGHAPREHEAIAEAVRDGDADRAAKAMRHHLEASRQRLRVAYE